MPFLAILGHELRSLSSSWLVRLWLAGTALLTFLLVASNWAQMPSSVLIALVLLPYLIFPWCLIVMILGISPVTGPRLDALADGILSRPVTLEELSPISLTQALPTVLKTPWREMDGTTVATSQKDMDELTQQAANFLSALSTGSTPTNQPPPKFFEDGDYEDYSVFRVLCGYGLPALFAVGLALLVFHRRDL